MNQYKQASTEDARIRLDPIGIVRGIAFEGESGRHIQRVEVLWRGDAPLKLDNQLYTYGQVQEFNRLAVSEALAREAEHMSGEFEAFESRINAVYHERNQLAIALARMALIYQAINDENPFTDIKVPPAAGYGFDEKTGRAVVYVTLPMGDQVSWHMSDKITEQFKKLGVHPLPPFEGEWDGTFKARQDGWPLRYVRTQKSLCDQVRESTSRVVHITPPGATHYRTCSGGMRRFYKQPQVGGEWLYFHQDEQAWHPTDLSNDYLESHIHRLDCDAQAEATTQLTARVEISRGGVEQFEDLLNDITRSINESELGRDLSAKKPLTRQQARGYGMVFGLETIGKDATHVMMPCELHGMPGAIYRVHGTAVDQYMMTVKTDTINHYKWCPAAVSADWVKKHAHPIQETNQ